MTQSTGTELVVDLDGGPGVFKSINDAVNAAHDGAVIRVRPGVYREKVVIDHRLILIGERRAGGQVPPPGHDGSAVISGGGAGDVVIVKADGVVITGLVITGSGSRLENNDAGIKVQSRGSIIEGNLLENNAFGIYLEAGGSNTVKGNRIRGQSHLERSQR
ncbi:MAG: right-handed parallel beta-helix repeat-containing protein, partial [Firmicutes bacterium]|nr:right-handed parallel beta-helix repeat-containing protein [Bacillota bacterium]